MKKVAFRVEGLCCTDEMSVLKKALNGKPGIGEIEFDLVAGKMVLEIEPEVVSQSELIELIGNCGYRAIAWGDLKALPKESFLRRNLRLWMALASGLLIVLGALAYLYFPHATNPLLLISIIFGGWNVAPKAVNAAMRLRPDINLLLVVATIGAIFLNELFEASITVFLFSVAVLLEYWSVERARRSISELLDLAPKVAHVISPETGEVEEMLLEDVQVGMHVVVRPGDRVPVDGTIVRGQTTINEAPITGESLPEEKKVDDPVYAGTINEGGAFECVAEKTRDDSALAQIIKLVEEAQSKRAHTQRWVERFAVYYTPIMILIALAIALIPPITLGLLWTDWIYRALVVLVIACPCSLVISTPVAIVSALTTAARQGVLIKGGKYIEIPANLRVIAMDKTGTLTYGTPKVQEIVTFGSYRENAVLDLAAAIEQKSEHPLGRAILRFAKSRERRVVPCEEFTLIKGKGARATVDGHAYWIGSHRMLHEVGVESEEVHAKATEMEDAGHTVVALGDEQTVLGLFSIADAPREGVKEDLEAIRQSGIEKIVMLTGDNNKTASALAQLAGVDEFHSQLLPKDKLAYIEKYRRQGVAMVGDGVNDAPAMALSDLGIAMGVVGTDIAIETADIALMSDDLSKLGWLIGFSRRTLSVIKQNITASILVKIIFLNLSVVGWTTLWMAIVADTGMSIVVIANSLRLLRKAPKS